MKKKKWYLDIEEQIELNRRAQKANCGDIPYIPLSIARAVLTRAKSQNKFLSYLGKSRAMAVLVHTQRWLNAEQWEWLLRTMFTCDESRLQHLIDAIKLCKSGPSSKDPRLLLIISCYTTYVYHYRKRPTLSDLHRHFNLAAPKTSIDERTLRYICKREGIFIAGDKRGRPKKSVVKKKRLPI